MYFSMDEVARQVEALLFACGRKMSIQEFQGLLGTSSGQVIIDALQALKHEYEQKNSSLMLVEEGDFWKFTTREAYLPLVRKINPNTELSKTMMETLAVIAWKQPILQSEVIRIRTNKAYEHVDELEKMQFLVKEKYGRTYLLKLTQKFYDYFDLEGEQQARALFKELKDSGTEQKKVGEFNEVQEKSLEDDPMKKKESEEVYTHLKKEKRDLKEAAGEEEETVYSASDRESLVEEDEITPNEDAFMEGYNEAEKKVPHEKSEKKEEDEE